jgi:hypothetical protein
MALAMALPRAALPYCRQSANALLRQSLKAQLHKARFTLSCASADAIARLLQQSADTDCCKSTKA